MSRLKQAVKALKTGRVIAFPTETVFGLGAALNKPRAVKLIFKIKGRPRNKPLQILVSSLEQAKELGRFIPRTERYARRKWPGPTLILPKTRKVSKLVTGGSSKVGLRIPKHKTTLKLIEECGPIVATSANKSGEKPALTAVQAGKILPEVKHILSGRSKSGKPSQVIDTTNGFKVLRP